MLSNVTFICFFKNGGESIGPQHPDIVVIEPPLETVVEYIGGKN